MRVMVTDIQDQGEQEAIIDGTCDRCFEWGYYNQYLVTFFLMMSDGTSYEIKSNGVVSYDRDKDKSGRLKDYTYTGPIPNILKFVSDIKGIEFPDIEFFEDRKEYIAARRPGNMIIPEDIGPQENLYSRYDCIRKKLEEFIIRVIKRYADNGVDGINQYISERTYFARKGN